MAVRTLIVGQLQTNCYLYYSSKTKQTVIIDPGDDADFIISKIQDLKLKPKAIIATHGHFDHVLAAFTLQKILKLPFYLAKLDFKILQRMLITAKYFVSDVNDPPPEVTNFFKENSSIYNLKVIPTPGHTEGSVSLYNQEEGILFTGDLIFADGLCGRTDLEGGNRKKLLASIKKILKLPKKTAILSGHGRASTIAQEIKYYSVNNLE